MVTGIINKINLEFGKEAPLTITRGKMHDYLGMELELSTVGKVIFTMIHYIQEMLSKLPSEMHGSATTPAANHLFTVRDTDEKLDKQRCENTFSMYTCAT